MRSADIEQDHFLRQEAVQVEAKRAHIGREPQRILIENHESPRLGKLHRPAHEEFCSEHPLSAPRAVANERREPRGKTPALNFIKASNASRRFREGNERLEGWDLLHK